MPISDLNDLLIHGYCRRVEPHLSIQPAIIPSVIRLLVSIFFEREYFEIINDQYIKHMDGKTQQTIKSFGRRPNTSYGSISIPTTGDNQCIYSWTIKILNKGDAKAVYIGIDEYNKYQALCTVFAGLDCRSNYAYASYGSLLCNSTVSGKSYSRRRNSRKGEISKVSKFAKSDTITMRLDLINNILSFKKNGRRLAAQFIKIQRGKYIKYRLAVCIPIDVEVSLLDSNIQR